MLQSWHLWWFNQVKSRCVCCIACIYQYCTGEDAETLDGDGKVSEAKRRTQKAGSVNDNRMAQIHAINASKEKNQALTSFLSEISSKEGKKATARVEVAFQRSVSLLRGQDGVENLEEQKQRLRDFRTKMKSSEKEHIDEVNSLGMALSFMNIEQYGKYMLDYLENDSWL